MAFLDKIGLEHLWAHIINKLGNKVDKVEGKDLSTNDFTDEEKTKLANAVLELEQKLDIVETGATIATGDDLNNYKTPGNYICVASNTSQVLNCPVTTNGFKLIVITGYNQERKHQFLLRGANSDLYYRMFNSTDSVWTNWINLNTSLTGLGITATAEELNYMDGVTSNVQTQLNAKVPTSRTVNGKVLSGNITLSAEDIGADASGSASAALTTAKAYTDTEIGEWVGNTTVSQQITTAIADKVDKVDGKGLSTNDYTTAEKNKLTGIATGAEANQNAFGIIKTKSGSVNATVNADAKVDTVTFEAGDNITLITNENTGVIKIVGADAPEAPEASLESLGISATPAEINYLTGASSNIQAQLNSMLDVTETGIAITANSDLNNYKTPGNYICIASNTSTLTNCPVSTQGFKLIVITGYSADRYHQILLRGGSSDFYYRMYNSTDLEWTNWVNLNTTVSLSDLGITATAAELNKMDGVTATTAELNILDGLTATTTELNYVDGVTSNIQTQLNAKVPTSRTVNGKALSSNISLTYSDVDAAPEEHTHDASDITAGTLAAARLPNISIDKLVAGTTNTTIPSSLLPAYVDDVLEYAAKANFPTTGETGKIYVDKTTNLTWRWSGSAYVEISPSLALGTTSSTAYRGDLGAAAYAHAVTNKGVAKSSGFYKITTNSEGHVTAGTAVTKADITGLGIPGEKSTLSDLGITATAAELNKMDGVTATTAELNYVDGVTSNIQTQLNNRLNLSASGTAINENDDLNDYTTPGVYTAVLSTAQSLSNTPCKAGFKLIVMQGYSNNYISQFIFRGNANRWWYRSYSYVSAPIWTDWQSYLPTSGGTLTDNLTIDKEYAFLYLANGDGETVGAFYGSPTEHKPYILSYPSDNSGYYEGYGLPAATTGLTAHKWYNILTTKNKVTAAQGGTGHDFSNIPANAVIRNSSDDTGLWYTATANGALYATAANGAIRFGTLPVAQGGTGGTTAKAAAYNLLNDMNDSTVALTDDSKFIFKLATTASTENGVLMTKPASLIWNYIKSKADSHYLGINTTLPITKGGTNATTAKAAAISLGVLDINSTGTAIPSGGADLNTYKTPGVYNAIAAVAAACTNSPTTAGFRLVVTRGYSDARYTQTIYSGSNNSRWYRAFNGSTWGAWEKQFTGTSDEVTTSFVVKAASYPAIHFKDSDDGKVKAAILGTMGTNRIYLRSYATDTNYYENYYMPIASTGLTANVDTYFIWTNKQMKYSSSQPTNPTSGDIWFKPV